MILLQKISKRYPLYARPMDRLLNRPHNDFWALRDINLSIAAGEFVAFIGPNGSGKSTLLQIVSGIVQPTSGRVVAQGRIAALLELGAGFNPEFTGRENVYLNAEIMGVSKGELSTVFPRIADFAQIGEFMDRPVKEYSSGMYVRLAFSTAIHVDPEILIVDEALAVGDAIFASRCVRKFEELKSKGVTVLFVSHDLGLVKRLADRAVLLLQGKIEMDGAPREVVNHYIGLVHEWQATGVIGPLRRNESGGTRHGDGASEVAGVTLHNAGGESITAAESGEKITVKVRAKFHRETEDPIAGILIRNRLGIDVFGTNTRVEGRKLGSFIAGDVLEIDFTFPCLLTQQDYTLTAAMQNWDGSSQDWLDDVISFTVTADRAATGFANLPTTIEIRRNP